MSNNNPTLKGYLYYVSYQTVATGFGFPAELVKIRLQNQLDQSAYSVAKQCFQRPLLSFYTGFTPSLIRQYSKMLYRPLLLTALPNKIDSYSMPSYLSTFLKAVTASSCDVLIGSVLENVKTTQITHSSKKKNLTPAQATRSIYQNRGVFGFFTGTPAMVMKSMPAWLNFFLAYQIMESKRERRDFVSTLFWGTMTSTPITTLTTPFDVMKTRQQASQSGESLLQTMKHTYSKYGLASFFRGYFPRLLHKSLSTTGGFLVYDISRKLTANIEQTKETENEKLVARK